MSATTIDWGDVQPEDLPGIWWTNNTHPAISIYSNAMLIIAMENLVELSKYMKDNEYSILLNEKLRILKTNTMEHLWDPIKQKFIPHIYLEKGSPFDKTLDELSIYYHGGTAVAI